MELKDYLLALRQRWLTVAVCTMLGVLLAALATLATPRVYEASTELFVAPEVGGTSSELAQGSSFVLDRVKSYVEVINRDLVLTPVIDDLGLDTTVTDLSEDVSASVIEETVIVVVTVRADTAEGAAQIANSVATEFVAVAPSLEPRRADESGVVRVTVTDPARTPRVPVSPQPVVNLALGLLVGLAAGIAAAVTRQAMDRRVRNEADVKELTDAAVMGHIPSDASAEENPLVTGAAHDSIRAESLRQLRTNLQFLNVGGGRRSYVITSSMPGEGKTTTSLNLAITMAEAGKRVCLLEADLRRPMGASYLNLEGSVGLTDVLIESATWEEVTQPWAPGLDVILSGRVPPNPSDLLVSGAMDDMLHALEQAYDVVIVDAPPLLPVTDAAILARRCTGAIVVVGLGRTAVSREELADSLEILKTVDAKILGIVLNRIPQHGPHGRAHAYYSYGTRLEESALRASRRAPGRHTMEADAARAQARDVGPGGR